MSLLSKDISLNLAPNTGSSKHPLPFPPVKDILLIDAISNSWGSTKTFSTLPDKIGSINAVVPAPASTEITGGLIISYSSPPFKTSISSNGPKKILSSDIGECIWTPSIKIPISFTGVSCFDDTNKFCERGIFLNTLSECNLRFACLWRTKLCVYWVAEPIPTSPTCIVLADPIWALES